MEKQYIGIDPGKQGAIAILQGQEVKLLKFPMIGTEYDTQGMFRMFKSLKESGPIHVVLEDVKALQGPMKAGNWSLSRGKTIIEMCCVGNDIPFTMVHSKTWQKEVHQGIQKMDTKAMTLTAVKRLFPLVDLRPTERSKKEDDGMADALAMAYYCKLKFI